MTSHEHWTFGAAVAEDGVLRRYLMHKIYPRFVVRFLEVENDAGDASAWQMPLPEDVRILPRDVAAILCDVLWIDQPETCAEEASWLNDATMVDEVEGVRAMATDWTMRPPANRQGPDAHA